MRWMTVIILLVYAGKVGADMIDDAVQEAVADAVRKPMISAGMKENAVQGLSKGLVSTKFVRTGTDAAKKTKKYVERKAYKTVTTMTGLKREHAAAAVVIGMGVTQGKVGTKGIKYRFRPVDGMTIRPDLIYDWRGREVSSTVNLKWEF